MTKTPTLPLIEVAIGMLRLRADTMNGAQKVGAGDGNTYVPQPYGPSDAKLDRYAAGMLASLASLKENLVGTWRPIAEADKTITEVHDFVDARIQIRNSDRYWVRDDDGRVYEASWSEGRYGRDYWWDWEAESPVDPVEFMPHPLDPRFAATAALDAKQ